MNLFINTPAYYGQVLAFTCEIFFVGETQFSEKEFLGQEEFSIETLGSI